ncbi:STE20-related kinase adapter protein stlk-like [Musca autumnalis]|uniref:STE20-related kinase adapter protein stlk-like n=1 Tax=Musca autumnalis TaxID=221902 RepID=UPI003CF10E37
MFGWNIKDYDIKLELSRCSNGVVYMAKYLPNQQYVTVKKYHLDRNDKQVSDSIQDDIMAMRLFSHPNLHKFHTAFVNNSDLYVVSPLMCFGSCRDSIRNIFKTGFPEIFIALIMRDVLSGLEYLHRRGYVHRSIRASHILLNQTKAVLTGFRDCTSFISHGGRVTVLHQLPPNSIRSLNWLAPEVLEQNLLGYTEKSDIYSIGITCCELANGVEPFADSPPTFMFTEKIRGNVPTLLDRSTCPGVDEMIDIIATANKTDTAVAAETQQIYLQRMFSDEFHQFTEICMEKKPGNRWSALKLLSHSFFKQCRHSSILDVTQRFGMQVSDYEELRDESLQLNKELNDLNLNDNNTWEWEFD